MPKPKSLAEEIEHLRLNPKVLEQARVTKSNQTMIGKRDCVDCHGLGYLRRDFPVGHPEYGKLEVCVCAKDVIAMREADKLARASDLLPEDYRLRWNHIMPTDDNRETIETIKTNLARGYGWIFVHGHSGPGKSLVLKTAISESIAEGKAAIYSHWYSILDDLRKGVGDGTFGDNLNRWRDIPVLAIDEMFRNQDTEWVFEVKPKLLDYRYELAMIERRAVTIFGSNYGLDEMEEWLASRMKDGRAHVLEMKDKDMRPSMTW